MDQATRHFILATAGHVDHGKSALVRALTCTDPDRLPEEKARGITIDLGFAELPLTAPDGANLSIGIVDVPGHEDFIKNMVAGVGSIDAALLVVAADDGWMPQTEEHLQILSYLSVQAGVVALTKADLIDSESAAIDSIRSKLADTPLANLPIVPTSIITGRGIDELKTAIASMFSKRPPPRDIGKPRLPIDRAFILKGVGTVVTGTLIGGILKRGQHVTIQPGDRSTRIRAMQSHSREIESAVPATRLAVNLPDISPTEVARGHVLTSLEAGRPTRRLCALLTRMNRPTQSKSATSLSTGAATHFHHGTATSPARIRLLNTESLKLGQSALALLTLQNRMLVFAGDRFILRDGSQQISIAGGVVLDPIAPSFNRKRQAYWEALVPLSQQQDDAKAHMAAHIARCPVIQRNANLLSQSNFNANEVTRGITDAINDGVCVGIDDLLIDPNLWFKLRGQALVAVMQHHQQHPEQNGMLLTQLRAILTSAVRRSVPTKLLPSLENAIVQDLRRDDILYINGVLRHRSHHPALPPRLREAGEIIRKRLAERPFDPPSRKEVAQNDVAQQALRFLIATGIAVDLSPDVVVSSDAFGRAIEQIRGHLASKGASTISELKTLLGSSRRVVVPLLERLDRDGITCRHGDLRELRKTS